MSGSGRCVDVSTRRRAGSTLGTGRCWRESERRTAEDDRAGKDDDDGRRLRETLQAGGARTGCAVEGGDSLEGARGSCTASSARGRGRGRAWGLGGRRGRLQAPPERAFHGEAWLPCTVGGPPWPGRSVMRWHLSGPTTISCASASGLDVDVDFRSGPLPASRNLPSLLSSTRPLQSTFFLLLLLLLLQLQSSARACVRLLPLRASPQTLHRNRPQPWLASPPPPSTAPRHKHPYRDDARCHDCQPSLSGSPPLFSILRLLPIFVFVDLHRSTL
ncbi:hypothetical protein MN608_06652 [Microdochium nivale]|nr:hypothetical protein MN608_06652 [Microdochium nivale]